MTRVFNQRRLAIQLRRVRVGALAAVLALTTACSVPGLWTYQSSGQGSGSAGGNGAFDAASYVAGIWDSKVVATISSKAVDAATLLPAIKKDPTAAAQQYGVASQATGGSPSFMIKGSGTVSKYDKANPNGPITVTVGGQDIQVDTGPVLIGTALRDAVGIGFGDFANQIDYQSVATQLNTKAKAVAAPIVASDPTGKTLTFEGAFTLLDPSTIAVIPSKLSVS
jgi:predicted lipoprotein